MKCKLIDNPFVVYGYEGPEYFCDREKETEQLISLLTNGNNVVLIFKKQGIQRKLSSLFHSLRPTMSFDALDGTPTVSFDIVPEQSQATLTQVFNYIKISEKRCFLAIDEFQQTLQYP